MFLSTTNVVYSFTSWSLTSSRGGVRGIVELEVLKAIERELGGKLPIQVFFDLMVGTRYVSTLNMFLRMLSPKARVVSLR